MSGAYATGSGSVKVATSEESEAARTAFTDGIMEAAYLALERRGARGGTTREIARMIKVEKGRTSTAITNMYIMDHVARLNERRLNHYVHVLPQFIGDRATIPYVPQKKHLQSEEAVLLAERLALFLEDRSAWKTGPSLIPQPGDHELARHLRYVVGVSRGRKPTTRR